MVTDSQTKSLLCVKAAVEKKAFDLVLLEMKKITSFTDYFLICSGKSDRQVQAIAQAIEEALEREGIRPLGSGGKDGGKMGFDGLWGCGGSYLFGTCESIL